MIILENDIKNIIIYLFLQITNIAQVKSDGLNDGH